MTRIPETIDSIETFYPTDPKAWRKWLEKYHDKKPSVWLICYKKSSGKPTLSWSDAVDEALCFGWIDGKRRSVDKDQFIQFFCKRKPRGTWSKVNKEKIKHLIRDGRMTQAGLDTIDAAKKNGSWTILDQVEDLTVPPDLLKEFRKHKGSKAFFEGLSKSVKKVLLHRLMMAKRPETRQKRLSEIIALADKK